MITKAKLIFGKHNNRTFHFGAGVNIIRGANEAGKSTVMGAIAYNAFGAALLPFDLPEYTNKDSGKLRTEVHYQIDGVKYVLTRGKSGAELRGEDGTEVTNHGPVTAKMEQLLGIPAGKASHTIYAAQNQVRGVMGLGPTATSQFIEQAAGFDQIDNLITKLDSYLDTGNIKHFEEQIKDKKQEIHDLKNEALPDTKQSKQREQELVAELAQLQQKQAEERAAIANVKQRNLEIQRQREGLEREIQDITRTTQTRASLEKIVNAASGCQELIDKANDELLEYNRWNLYQRFTTIPSTEDVWEGDRVSMMAEIDKVTQNAAALKEKIWQVKSEITARQGERLTSTTCPITGNICQELTDPQLIEQRNREIDQDIKQKQEQLGTLQVQKEEEEETERVLKNILTVQLSIEQQISEYGQNIEVDKTQVPWKLTWISRTDPVDPPSADLSELHRKVQEADRAQAQLEVLSVPSRTKEEVEQEIERLPKPVEVGQEVTDSSLVETKLKQAREEIATAEKLQHHRQETLGRLDKEVEGLEDKVKVVQENNDLIKAVKAGRLLVTDMLWTKVLHSVSAYFSKMRGEQSVIERTPKGFRAGEERALSGSTLDVLAVSLRITMAKLFTRSPVIMSDEGSQGCDDVRTAAMTATLASAGFDQVIMVTHKDLDEAADATLIEV